MGIPKQVRPALARALGAFIRDVPTNELPRGLKRWRSFRPQGLAKHEDEIVAALDEHAVRERVLKWLEDGPRLNKRDAELLRIASERHEDWEASLQSRAPSQKPSRRVAGEPQRDDLRLRLERERSKGAVAREELKRVRADSRRELQMEKKRAADLAKEVEALARKLDQAGAALERSRLESERAADRAERELRRARSDSEKARAERDDIRSRLREANKEKRELAQRVRRLESTVAAKGSERTRRTPSRAAAPRRRQRKPLRPPQGLFEESPQALDEWLGRDGVKLLVDGYNVVKSSRGFKGARLSDQRDRLVQETARLARRKNADVMIVFDGSEEPPPAGEGPVLKASRLRRRPPRGPSGRPPSGPGDRGHERQGASGARGGPRGNRRHLRAAARAAQVGRETCLTPPLASELRPQRLDRGPPRGGRGSTVRIDCTACEMYQSHHCSDCLVTALLHPPSDEVVIDEDLDDSLEALSGAGLIPVLKFTPRREGVADPEESADTG